ncbi:PPE domain-containing protein [Nocardia sp. NPDC127579]|uniref:PPE domain-containing protein n=1 Tax=Nocardia sp. NPDC127579 TaxID=3345402 RepID=UPI003624D82F
MELNVDLAELVAVASSLAERARGTNTAMPGDWVFPAGSDGISAAKVPALNTGTQLLVNGVNEVLTKTQRVAYEIGASAVGYSATDDESARRLAGVGGDLVGNPVGAVQEYPQQYAPTFLMPVGAVDPLTFAQQLRAGPGPGPASRFATDVRTFATGPLRDAADDLDRAARAMQNWTPVGAEAAEKLSVSQGLLDQLGTGMQALADEVDAYTAAFTDAKAKHPTPEEIMATRKELVSAMRAKDELRIAQAMAKFEEENARSAATISGYSAATGTSEGTGSGSGDTASSLAQMLPTLLSALSSAGSSLNLDDYSDMSDLEDYGYDYEYDYPGSSYPGGGGGSPVGLGSGSPTTPVEVGAMPVVGTSAASSAASALPRTSVIEPLSSSASSSSPASRAGSPYMPYMPMSPGMGGAGNNNERNRVVAWHPDRLMYVDATPHTDLVIGERPTIAPTVTPPTPAPSNQIPTQSGGAT